MIELYPQAKAVHVACVAASGTLFALRGLLVLAGRQHIALATPVRRLSYGIDTVLLATALLLLAILPGAVFANGWLAAKLGLLVVYVVLGTFALRRGRSPGVRTACYVGALCTFVFIASIARTHHPGGILWLFAA